MTTTAFAAVVAVASLCATATSAATFDISLGNDYGWLKFEASDSDADGRIVRSEVSAFTASLLFGSAGGPSERSYYSTALDWLDIGLTENVLTNALDQVSFSTPGVSGTCFDMQGEEYDFALPNSEFSLSGGSLRAIIYELSYEDFRDPANCGPGIGVTPYGRTEIFGTASLTISGSVSQTPAPVPLPGGLALMSGALVGVGALRRRRRA